MNLISFNLVLFVVGNIAVAKGNHESAKTSRSSYQQGIQKPKLWLETEMGHRNSEKINFSSWWFEGHTAYVISYLVNEKVLAERVVPKDSFTDNIEKLRRALPRPSRERLAGIMSCSMPFTLIEESATGNEVNYLCLDHASTVEVQATSKWWKDLRSLIND